MLFRMGYFFMGANMHLKIIQTYSPMSTLAHKIARVVYAETDGATLVGVEALTSMIKNISEKTGRSIDSVIADYRIFSCLQSDSPRHKSLGASASSPSFQMCVRVAQRMLSGVLPDSCFGATCFHHCDCLPQWAVARGYIADISGMLFYL